jgi:NAD(P)H-dependent nitrite reductase small subunit
MTTHRKTTQPTARHRMPTQPTATHPAPTQSTTTPGTAQHRDRVPPVIEIHDGRTWQHVCHEDDLTPGRGVAVLLGDQQIALFRDRSGALYAVGNRDPFSGAYVISRGLLGSRNGTPAVFSPMYKQAWDPRDGRCLDEDETPGGTPAALPVWPVRRSAAAARAAGAEGTP